MMMKTHLRYLLVIPSVLAVLALTAADTPATTSPDPLFSQQWALHNDGSQVVIIREDSFHSLLQPGVAGVDINYQAAKDEITQMAKTPVIVAVLDSGLDVNHPELKGRIADGGFNFLAADVKHQTDLTDPTGHGTETAGVIVANTDNGIGISGLTPSTVKVLPLAFLGGSKPPDPVYENFVYNGKLISDYAADAIRYAIAHHANVINMSLSWPKLADTENVRKALQEAFAANVLVVAASGNDAKDSNPYPCAYDGVVCVSAVTNNGQLGFYSNYGANNDVLAPGDSILTTFPQHLPSAVFRAQGYESARGTSIATPYVSGLAAILKSAFPTISMSELKARLFLSGADLPTPNAALFGLINVKKALEAKPQPVYYPHFKLVGNLPIDEINLQVSSSISVENLWGAGTNVKAQVTVNGKPVGEAQAVTLGQNQSITVPWSYRLTALTDSSLLHLQLMISDASGIHKTYSMDVVATRSVEKIPKQQVIAMPTAPLAWVGLANGIPYSVLQVVPTYGTEPGLPKYFAAMNPTKTNPMPAPIVQIFDPSRTTTANTNQLSLNGLQSVSQVMRIDITRTGHFAWLIIGQYSTDKDHTYMQFRFLDDNFQPLWGTNTNSMWQIQLTGSLGGLVQSHPFSSPGSWVLSKNQLIPCILGFGSLPDPDNYQSTDEQYTYGGNHFYYLNPIPQPLPVVAAQSGVTNLELRAVDSKNFRDQYPEYNLQNYIPPSNADLVNGHLRVLVELGHDTLAASAILDIPSIESVQSDGAPEWNLYSAIGSPYYIQTLDHSGTTSSFLDLFSDNSRASLTWVSSAGAYLGRTDFAFVSTSNPIVTPGLLGLFEIPNLGRIWFIESQFTLASFFQSEQNLNGTAVPEQSTFPIDRDSSYSSQAFAQQFTAVLVGTSSNPEPGIYMDLTLVRGDYVTIVTWNTSTHQLEKTARYSFSMPSNCAHMPPIRTGTDVNSFAVPMFCQNGSKLEYRIFQP
jgi:subtilisin family serine protease